MGIGGSTFNSWARNLGIYDYILFAQVVKYNL